MVLYSGVFETIAQPVIDLIESLVTPALGIVVAVAAVYVVILGAKLAKAEEPQEREKAKNSIKNGLIGFLLIFILLFALRVSYKPLVEWVNTQTEQTNSTLNK